MCLEMQRACLVVTFCLFNCSPFSLALLCSIILLTQISVPPGVTPSNSLWFLIILQGPLWFLTLGFKFSYGSLWFLGGAFWFFMVPLVSLGLLKVSQGFSGLLRGSLGFLKVPKSSRGFLRILKVLQGSIGFLLVPFGSFGFLKVPFGSLGFLRAPQGSLGFLRVPQGTLGLLGVPQVLWVSKVFKSSLVFLSVFCSSKAFLGSLEFLKTPQSSVGFLKVLRAPQFP